MPSDRDFISIEGFTKPFKKKDGSTGMSYMILNWESASAKNENNTTSTETTKSFVESTAESDPYKDFSEIDINDMLPF